MGWPLSQAISFPPLRSRRLESLDLNFRDLKVYATVYIQVSCHVPPRQDWKIKSCQHLHHKSPTLTCNPAPSNIIIEPGMRKISCVVKWGSESEGVEIKRLSSHKHEYQIQPSLNVCQAPTSTRVPSETGMPRMAPL